MLLSRRITVNYSFRAMAQDQVEVMERLGYREFFVAGHDRGARTTARICLDHPERVKRDKVGRHPSQPRVAGSAASPALRTFF
jgi:hypothetical protein